MYPFLLALHNWSRWLVLLLAVVALYKSFTGWQNNRVYTKGDSAVYASFTGFMLLQLLIGLLLYFVYSPVGLQAFQRLGGAVMKDPVGRFWGVEHITVMILAVGAAQVGRSLSKKQPTDLLKHKKAFTWFAIALVLVLLMIPWGLGEWNPPRPMWRGL